MVVNDFSIAEVARLKPPDARHEGGDRQEDRHVGGREYHLEAEVQEA
ncbi:MAG: hypothetical protein CISAcid_00690 [uncultured Acidilobus sp. CIS]|nr:MAG: hypothetical protein CISAcid_00690 [uncultured Acidilobus sp. CIS]